jgi:hypothetical protein
LEVITVPEIEIERFAEQEPDPAEQKGGEGDVEPGEKPKEKTWGSENQSEEG